MTAEQFRAALRKGDNIAVSGQTVTGTVDVKGMRVRTPIVLDEVTFDGEVNFGDATFEHSLSFIGCSFRQGISLSYTTIHGKLLFESVRILDWRLQFMVAMLRLKGAKIHGSVELTRTLLEAPLDAQGVHIGGDFRVIGCDCREEVRLSGAFVRRNVEITAWSPARPAQESHEPAAAPIRTEICKILDLSEATVEGSIRFGGIRVGSDILLNGVKVGGSIALCPESTFSTEIIASLDMSAARVGSIFLGGVRVGGSMILNSAKVDVNVTSGVDHGLRTEIGGDWEMSATKVGSYIQLAGVLIDGAFRGNGLKCSSATFGLDQEEHPCRIGGFFGLAMEIEGWLSLNGVQITGTAFDDEHHQGIWIGDTHIKGRLVTWSPALKSPSDNAARAAKRSALVAGSVVFQNCTISGICDFTNLRVTGSIDLSNSEITGSLLFRSAYPEKISLAELPELRANARRLELVNVTCRGDVDLTGLSLQESSSDTADSKLISIDAKDLTCRGNLILCTVISEAKDGLAMKRTVSPPLPEIDRATDIPGKADFTRVVANRMVVSGRSFYCYGRTHLGKSEQLILAGAKFGEVAVPEGTEIYPIWINLADLSVRNWLLAGDPYPDPKIFKELLKRDRVRRDTYRAIEAYFRDRGHDNAAGWISIAMNDRISKGEPGFLRRIKEFIRRSTYGVFLGYGNSPVRLGGVILSVWLLALPIYFARENFEPSLALQSVLVDTDRESLRKPPSPCQWGDLRPLFVSLRYHVPIFASAIETDWSLRDSGPLYYPLICNATLKVVPERIGTAILLLNWIMWPPFLAFLLRKAFRDA
jgi:hypothetical protein